MSKARVVFAVVVGVALSLTTDRLIPGAAAQDAPVFTSESSLVVLHVTVKDKQGRYVGGLSKDAFDIFEDGRPQAVSLFTVEDAPVTVGVLIDSSGSMYANRDLVLAAATAFVERSNPKDEVFGLTFNETVLPALPQGRVSERRSRAPAGAGRYHQGTGAHGLRRNRGWNPVLADGQYERRCSS